MSLPSSTRWVLNAVASSSKRAFSGRPSGVSSPPPLRRPSSSSRPSAPYGLAPSPRPEDRSRTHGSQWSEQSNSRSPARFSSPTRPPARSPSSPFKPPPTTARIPLNFKFTSLTTDHQLAFNLQLRRRITPEQFACFSPSDQQRHDLILSHLTKASKLGMDARSKLFEELDVYDQESIDLERTRKERLREEVEKRVHWTKDSLTMREWDDRSRVFVEKHLEGKEGRQRELALKNITAKEAKFRRETVERREIMREMEVEKKRLAEMAKEKEEKREEVVES
ncbi:hypothetical protein BDY24DRAFT_114799 [Mrakia frigida]|uniref:uncharacterized protein n=1 Tax=Mrakia frigida TaxID=29902 RepID=UPI003FCC2505